MVKCLKLVDFSKLSRNRMIFNNTNRAIGLALKYFESFKVSFLWFWLNFRTWQDVDWTYKKERTSWAAFRNS